MSCGIRACGALFYKVFAGSDFCLGVSKIVILKENGVVNGVVECRIKCIAIVRTIVYNKKEDMYEKGVLLLWQSQQIYMLE